MKILITNDDSYTAQGIHELVEIMRPYGDITVIAPKIHQSGMSMSVELGFKPVAVKKIKEAPGERWWYVDGSPSTCVKYGIDEVFTDGLPDVVLSGINHGSNAATAMLYSATIGGAQEGALAGIPSFALSLDTFSRKADFGCVRAHFPAIFESLMARRSGRYGIFYNINFPNLPAEAVKGVRFCRQGILHWSKEFEDYDPGVFARHGLEPIDTGVRFFPEVEEGEKVYMLTGTTVDDSMNDGTSDHRTVAAGYISIVPHNIDMTDYEELERCAGIL